MPWCPKCKIEYREEFTNCGECGCELVKDLASADGPVMGENDMAVYFMSVASDSEAKVIESKLTAFGVPSFKESKGIDGVYGLNLSGVDIYVPANLLDNAKDIIGNESK
jgi:hypothetical protein